MLEKNIFISSYIINLGLISMAQDMYSKLPKASSIVDSKLKKSLFNLSLFYSTLAKSSKSSINKDNIFEQYAHFCNDLMIWSRSWRSPLRFYKQSLSLTDSILLKTLSSADSMFSLSECAPPFTLFVSSSIN